MENKDVNPESEAEKIIREQESSSQELPTSQPTFLGKIKTYEQDTTVMEEIGWIRVNPENLPSQGIFYPEGTLIHIRAASTSEIRHWSTLDDEDILSIDDALGRIIEKCTKVRFPNGMMGNAKDIKEIDRFYLVFAIREITFKRGENQLNVTFKCKSCTKSESKVLTKEMLNYYTPDQKLQARFEPEVRGFHLKLQTGEDTKLYLPSLGVMNFIKGYINEKRQNQEEFDQAFIKWAPFLFADYRILTRPTFEKMLQDSFSWSNDKISVIDWFVENMKKTVNPEFTNECSACGTEVSAPLSFPGGTKSLFLLSDIESKLV